VDEYSESSGAGKVKGFAFPVGGITLTCVWFAFAGFAAFELIVVPLAGAYGTITDEFVELTFVATAVFEFSETFDDDELHADPRQAKNTKQITLMTFIE
jgi:hypothetical protein